MKHLGRTRPFRDADGNVIANSIAEVRFLRLGGVEQWVMIRGWNIDNPPLVLLHGGPGMPETFFFQRFNSPLERSFTVVYWEQRGAGKSYDAGIPRSSMTVERFIADLDELVDHVRQRLGKAKVTLFGHSWGTALGCLYAARFPEKVAAYVGSGQIGDWQAAERATYAYALAKAERQGNRKAVAALRGIGPPPHDGSKLWTQRMWLNRLDGQMSPMKMLAMSRMMLAGPERSVFDLPNLYRGFRWSIDAMWPEASRLSLLKLAPTFQAPVFFFLGRKDTWVAPETSVAYFDTLTAPAKRIVWFEASGHEPFVDEPAKFNALMEELVRPAVA